MKNFVVMLRPGSRWNPKISIRDQDHWDDHAQFMDALFEAGVVILGGPFADRSGSMVLLNAASVEQARALFQDDPWTRCDVLVVGDIREWCIFLDRTGQIGTS